MKCPTCQMPITDEMYFCVHCGAALRQDYADVFSTGYVIAEPCIGVKDSACVNVCPVDCIHPRRDEARFEAVQQLYIDPDTCIDCGACVPECPVSAIFPVYELPDRWKYFAEKNADWYKLSAKDFQSKWGSLGR